MSDGEMMLPRVTLNSGLNNPGQTVHVDQDSEDRWSTQEAELDEGEKTDSVTAGGRLIQDLLRAPQTNVRGH